MNFLAHVYLSFGNGNIIVGNLIADFVRGKQIDNYPESIRKGIRLHRSIDSYTDHHPIVKETQKVFHPSVGRYAGAFLDIAFDHFLALDTNRQPQQGWKQLAKTSYDQIDEIAQLLPPQFAHVYHYMKTQDWLSNYQHLWMIEDSFKALLHRATYLNNDIDIYRDFINNYQQIKNAYEAFFPQLETETLNTLKQINNTLQ